MKPSFKGSTELGELSSLIRGFILRSKQGARTMTVTASKLFFITGVSTGFGRAFARKALDAGHRVVGTLRNKEARPHSTI
jgi:hypothetical protein